MDYTTPRFPFRRNVAGRSQGYNEHPRMTQTYEVEIKSLLGSPERVEELRTAMKQIDSTCALQGKNRQLNHYFEPLTTLGSGGGSLKELSRTVATHLSDASKKKLNDLATRAKSFSVRTRDKDPERSSASDGAGGSVFLVVKASVGDDTSANGVTRMEFEERVPLALDKLDALVLSAGFSYQAKWSREREEYVCRGVNVTLDKNAGYGWLAEFEKMVDDARYLEEARREVETLMHQLGVEELPQDRLERMFAHYNAHWPEYYGTEKIFTIE